MKRISLHGAAALLLLAALVPASHAQLNENCTVSVLNRTAQVSADGFWRIDNVPASLGPVRARATCVENGVTRVGVSRWLDVPANGLVIAQDIVFAQPDPVPASLQISAPSTTISAAGGMVQLTAVATYPGGSTGDVSTRGTGTTWTSSNRNVITVSEDGLATAVAGGTVIISASNDGALGLIRIAAATGSLDSDGDGMPDDWEIANGLNPNDPADAALDGEPDGLTNLEEFNAGTNPWVYDTDGDGIGDGLESDTGTDPLDPGSFDLSRTLQSLSITPSPVVIYLNQFVSGGSAFVTVTGVLTDGATVDLTSRARGTQYAVDNPAVAMAGTGDGQVAGVAPGTALLTVTAGTRTATAPITVTQFQQSVVSITPVAHGAVDMAISGNYLFTAAAQFGIYVYDVTDRTAPRQVSHIPGTVWELEVLGNILYAANPAGETGVDVYDISVPTAPVKLGTKIISGGSASLAVSRGRIYSLHGGGLTIFEPWPSLSTVGFVAVNNLRWMDIDPSGTVVAAVSALQTWLTTIDVSDPAAPRVASSVTLPQISGFGVMAVRVAGNYAYVAEQVNTFQSFVKLDIVDIANPDAPAVLGWETGFVLPQLRFVIPRSGLLFTGGTGSAQAIVYDLANPPLPQPMGSVSLHNFSAGTDFIAVDAQYVYATVSSHLTPGTALHIARYVRVEDASARPPVVRILSPGATANLVEGTLLDIDVTATDDVAVDGIDLFVDGKRIHTVRSSPATFRYLVPVGTRSLTLQARAADFGGNVGESALLQLAVAADTVPPSVSILAPADGATVMTQSSVTVNVSATDDARLTSVALYANGELRQTRTAPPYSFGVFVSNPSGSQLPIEVRATDAAGNVGTASITLNVVGDQPPTVRILSPLTADGLYSGPDLRVKIEAFDDGGDPRVDVVVNGSNWDRLFRPPYEFLISLNAGTRSVRLAAKATDSAGQITTTPEIVLNFPFVETLSQLTLPGPGVSMAFSDDHAFIAAGRAGLSVVDVMEPAAPMVLGNLATVEPAVGVAVSGPYAFVAASSAGLIVADVANPVTPVKLATLPLPGNALGVHLDGSRVWVPGDLGVHMVDVRNPAVPRIAGLLPTARAARAITVSGSLAYVLHDDDAGGCSDCTKLLIVDISDAPRTLGSLSFDTGPGRVGVGLLLDGSTLYAYGENYILTVDVSDSAAPALTGTFDNEEFMHCCWGDVKKLGTMLFAANLGGTQGGVKLFDARNPADLELVGATEFSIPIRFYGLALGVTPDLIFATGDESGQRPPRYDSPPVSRLAIGRWKSISDTAGVAPSVSVTSPANDATFFSGEAVPIAVSATDDVAVKEVRIFVDGGLAAVQRVAPYVWRAPLSQGTHVLTATAIDYAGNERTSAEVTVHAADDIAHPSVRITAPAAGTTVAGPNIILRAEAMDDFSVSSVAFLVNDVPVGSDTVGPYELLYTIPAGTTSLTVRAIAEDLAGHQSSTQVTVSVEAPQLLGATDIAGNVARVAVNGRHAYIASSAGLIVADIETAGTPAIVGTLALPGNAAATDLRLNGRYVYVTDGTRLHEIDVAAPASPVITRSLSLTASSVDLSGTRAYVAGGTVVSLVDISDPAALTLVRTRSQSASPYTLIRAYESMALVNEGFRVRVWDMNRTPLTFFETITASTGVPSAPGSFNDYLISGNRLLMARGTSLFLTTVTAALSDPRNYVTADGFTTLGTFGDVVFAGRGTGGKIAILDIANRTIPPVLVGEIDLATADRQVSMAVTPARVITVTRDPNTGLSRLLVSRYRTISDTFGVAPTVTLTAGAVVPNRFLTLRASAFDDVAVASVTFTVNGADVFTDTIPPYEVNYLVPPGATSLLFGARVTDFGGNSATEGQ